MNDGRRRHRRQPQRQRPRRRPRRRLPNPRRPRPARAASRPHPRRRKVARRRRAPWSHPTRGQARRPSRPRNDIALRLRSQGLGPTPLRLSIALGDLVAVWTPGRFLGQLGVVDLGSEPITSTARGPSFCAKPDNRLETTRPARCVRARRRNAGRTARRELRRLRCRPTNGASTPHGFEGGPFGSQCCFRGGHLFGLRCQRVGLTIHLLELGTEPSGVGFEAGNQTLVEVRVAFALDRAAPFAEQVHQPSRSFAETFGAEQAIAELIAAVAPLC